ncbi:MAG: hypothetical protein ABI120_01430 [Gemmatimonadaceae bacterium]
MRIPTRVLGLVALSIAPFVAFAQETKPVVPVPGSTKPGSAGIPATNSTVPVPLVGPAIRRIETAQFLSTEVLGSITTVRHLPDGRILLNDGVRRRLLLMDSTLRTVGIVLDSLTDVQNAYGTRAGSLIPYRGDSTLFVDAATYAMLVIDSKGAVVRVRSVPRAQDVSYIAQQSSTAPMPGVDGAGRLVYRIPAQAARPAFRQSGDVPYFPAQPDSAFVVGIHLDTRKLDTLGAVKIQRQVISMTRSEFGISVRSAQVPLPLLDDFAVLSDGTVAFVRGRDFRIDYRAPDGTMTSSEKLAFPWVRMTEEDKISFTDSVKAVLIKNAERNFTQEMIVWSNLLNKPYPATFKAPEGQDPPPGLPKDWILPAGMKFSANYVFACPPSIPGAPPAPAPTPSTATTPGSAPGAPRCAQNEYANWYGSGYTPPPPTYRAPTLIPASELPDYRPPISAGSVRADMDDNLWIRTIQMKPMPGGTIYDIVNRKGELNDRIQLPVGFTLVGFGPGRIVYLSTRDASGLHLARVRLR